MKAMRSALTSLCLVAASFRERRRALPLIQIGAACATLAALSLVFIFAHCETVSAAENETIQPSWEAQARSHWEYRDNDPDCKETIRLLVEALKSQPDNRELWTWLCEAYYWDGNNTPEKEKDSRKKSYKAGADAGDQALKLNPGCTAARFWRIVNRCSYGREVGVLRSVFMLPEILREAKRIDKEDPKFFYGGVKRLWARIIYTAPAFLRAAKGSSLEEAIKYLNEALLIEPNCFMTHAFLADCYAEQKNMTAARTELRYVLDTPAEIMPALAPENRRDKSLAAARWKELGFDSVRPCPIATGS